MRPSVPVTSQPAQSAWTHQTSTAGSSSAAASSTRSDTQSRVKSAQGSPPALSSPHKQPRPAEEMKSSSSSLSVPSPLATDTSAAAGVGVSSKPPPLTRVASAATASYGASRAHALRENRHDEDYVQNEHHDRRGGASHADKAVLSLPLSAQQARPNTSSSTVVATWGEEESSDDGENGAARAEAPHTGCSLAVPAPQVPVSSSSLDSVPGSANNGSFLRHSPLLTLTQSPAHAMLFSSVYQHMSHHEDPDTPPPALEETPAQSELESATHVSPARTTKPPAVAGMLPTHHHQRHHQQSSYASGVGAQYSGATPSPTREAALTGAVRGPGGATLRPQQPHAGDDTNQPHEANGSAASPKGEASAVSSSPTISSAPIARMTSPATATVPGGAVRPHHHHHHHSAHASPPPGPKTGVPLPPASPMTLPGQPITSAPMRGGGYGGHVNSPQSQHISPQPQYGYPQHMSYNHHHNSNSNHGAAGYGGTYSPGGFSASPTMPVPPGERSMTPSAVGLPSPTQPMPHQPQPHGRVPNARTSPMPPLLPNGTGRYQSPTSSYSQPSPGTHPIAANHHPPFPAPRVTTPTSPSSAGGGGGGGGVRRDGSPYGRGGGPVGAPLPRPYGCAPPMPPHTASPTAPPPGPSPAAYLLYDHQTNDEVWVEDRKSELPFSSDVYGNVACLISAISPQVSVSHELEIPSQCNATFDNGTGLSGLPADHPAIVDTTAAAAAAIDSESTPRDEAGGDASSTLSGSWDAVGHYRYYRQFEGPSFSEPVARLRDVWEGFDSPFGYGVHLSQPVQLAGMKPPEDQVVYEPLLSGFRIGFHDAAPGYHHLAALRGVQTDRFPECRARARAAAAAAASAASASGAPPLTDTTGLQDNTYAETFSAVDVGVLSWSAAERPDSRHVVTRQIRELARADPLFEPLLTATTADVDHRSWVAVLWQPIFIGGHSSKHSCGSFLAYYMLRPPRHLFMPFAERSYGAAMNSAWSSPAFRADRAVINFDMWSFRRDYDVGRPVLPPTDKTLGTKARHTASATASGLDVEEALEGGGGALNGAASGFPAMTAAGGSFGQQTSPQPSLYATTPHSSAAAAGGWGHGEAMDEAVSAAPLLHAVPPTAPASTAPFICVPVVGLVPNRCRSEAWFVQTGYPLDPQELPSRRANKGKNGNGGASSPSGGAGAGGNGNGASVSTTPSASGVGAGGNGGGGGNILTRPQELVWPYRVPLFFLASALQLMCWNAYEEHLRRRRLLRACTATSSAEETTRGCAGPPAASPTTDANHSTDAVDESVVAVAASTSLSRRASVLPPPLQAEAVVNTLTFEDVDGSTAPMMEAEKEAQAEVPYYRCGVRLMNSSAQAYRHIRDVSKIDQAMEEGSPAYARGGGGGASAASASAAAVAGRRQSDSCAMAVAGGCSSGIRGAVRMAARGDYSESLGTVVGLLDFYRWAQLDTALQEFADNYCQA